MGLRTRPGSPQLCRCVRFGTNQLARQLFARLWPEKTGGRGGSWTEAGAQPPHIRGIRVSNVCYRGRRMGVIGQLQPLTTSEIRAGNDRSEGAAAIARCRKRGERSPKQTAPILGRQPARKAHPTAADNGIEVVLSTSSGQWRFRNPAVGIVESRQSAFQTANLCDLPRAARRIFYWFSG